MEDIDFNTTTNNTSDIEEYYNTAVASTVYRIFMELFTFLSLFCIAANILIIFVIAKYRRLKTDPANIIILHWAVLNTFFMLSQPIVLRISFFWTGAWSSTTLCIFDQAKYAALLGNNILIMLLFIYWFLKMYYPRKYEKYSSYTKINLGIIYIFLIFTMGVHIETCVNRRFFTLGEVFLFLTYLIFIAFMIIMNITHLIKKRKYIQTIVVSNTPYILCNTFFLSIFPLLFMILLNFLFRIEPLPDLVLLNITLVLAVMNPIYFFVVLYCFDKNYKTFLGYVMTCKCRKYGDDEFVEEPVVFDGNVQM